MPHYPTVRRLLAVASFFAVLGVGKACQPRVCTGYREIDGRETTVTGPQCERLHDILEDLRRRDPGGNIDLGRD